VSIGRVLNGVYKRPIGAIEIKNNIIIRALQIIDRKRLSSNVKLIVYLLLCIGKDLFKLIQMLVFYWYVKCNSVIDLGYIDK
jgi:hypothetical protein